MSYRVGILYNWTLKACERLRGPFHINCSQDTSRARLEMSQQNQYSFQGIYVYVVIIYFYSLNCKTLVYVQKYLC